MKKENVKKSGIVTNKEFSETNEYFRRCCEAVKVQPTARQASKFRNRLGKAYKEGILIIRRRNQNGNNENGNNGKRK